MIEQLTTDELITYVIQQGTITDLELVLFKHLEKYKKDECEYIDWDKSNAEIERLHNKINSLNDVIYNMQIQIDEANQ